MTLHATQISIEPIDNKHANVVSSPVANEFERNVRRRTMKRSRVHRAIVGYCTTRKRLNAVLAFDELLLLHQDQRNGPGVAHGSRFTLSRVLFGSPTSVSELFSRTTLPHRPITSRYTTTLFDLSNDKVLFSLRSRRSRSRDFPGTLESPHSSMILFCFLEGHRCRARELITKCRSSG